MAPRGISESSLDLQQRSDYDESDWDSMSLRDKASLSESSDSESAARERRQVHFGLVDNDLDVTIHEEAEPMSEDESRSYYMQTEDFKRCDHDVRRTVRKYIKHTTEGDPFDFTYCTIRGVEELIDHTERRKNVSKDTKSRAEVKADHMREVLNEVKRQKGQPLDAERIRQVSLQWSWESAKQSLEVAESDEEALRKIHPRWSVMHPRGPKQSESFEKPPMPEGMSSKHVIKSFTKPSKSLNPMDSFARRRGSKFGSFLRRKK